MNQRYEITRSETWYYSCKRWIPEEAEDFNPRRVPEEAVGFNPLKKAKSTRILYRLRKNSSVR